MIPWQSSSFNELMDLPSYSPIQSVEIYDDLSLEENILSGEAKSHSQIRNFLSQGERSKERDNHHIYKIRKYIFKTAHSQIKKLQRALKIHNFFNYLPCSIRNYKIICPNLINNKLLLIQKLWKNHVKKFMIQYRKNKTPLKIDEMQQLLLSRSFLAISSKDYFEALKQFWGDCKHKERFDEDIEIIEKNLEEYKIIAMYYAFKSQV